MFTLTFKFVDSKKTNTTTVTGRGDTFTITFSGNRIYRYSGVNPEHVRGRVIRTFESELKGYYVVMKGHTLFSLGDEDMTMIEALTDNPELVSEVDSLATFRNFIEL